MLSLWESIRRRFNELIKVEPQIRIIKLDNARYGTISDSLAIEGDYLCILRNDADDLYIALNRPIFWHKVPKFEYGRGIFEIKQAFRRIYIKHSAVSGGRLWLFAGFPEELNVRIVSEDVGNVWVKDTDNNKVNLWARGKTPHLYNVTCTNADTEYNQTLPSGTVKFMIKARGGQLKVSFTSGESGSTYILLNDGQTYYEDGIKVDNLTLYFQSPTSGVVAEIVAWTES